MNQQPNGDWGTSIEGSLSHALSVFLAAIPKVLAFIAIVLIGWLVITLVTKGIVALLRAIGVNKLSKQSGMDDLLKKANIKSDVPGIIAGVLKWFMWLIVLTAAFDALGLQAVSNVLQQWMLWVPNLIVGFVVVVLGGLAARFIGDLARGAAVRARLRNPDTLATIARIAIWSFAVIIALNQMGVAQVVVNTLFIGLVASLALAFGLAFGLGGRETADEIVTQWYHKGKEVADRASNGGGARPRVTG